MMNVGQVSTCPKISSIDDSGSMAELKIQMNYVIINFSVCKNELIAESNATE